MTFVRGSNYNKESRMIVDERLREDLKEIETRMDAIRGYL